MAAASDKVRVPNSFHWPIKNGENKMQMSCEAREKKVEHFCK